MASGGWSRNLRKLAYSDSDSDSGSDLGLQPTSQLSSTQLASESARSADAKLMQELDLASRRDEAHYKPNPWTIAKANAAVRPRLPVQPMHEQAAEPAVAKSLQGPIAEAFRVQSQRKRSAPPSDPTPSNHRCCFNSDPATTPLAHTFQDITSESSAFCRSTKLANSMRTSAAPLLTEPTPTPMQSSTSDFLKSNSGRTHRSPLERNIRRYLDQTGSQQGTLDSMLVHSSGAATVQHPPANVVESKSGVPGYHGRKEGPWNKTQDTLAIQDMRSVSQIGFRLRTDGVYSSPPYRGHGLPLSRRLSSTAFSSPIRSPPIYPAVRSRTTQPSNSLNFAGPQRRALPLPYRPPVSQPAGPSEALDMSPKAGHLDPQYTESTAAQHANRIDAVAANSPGSSCHVTRSARNGARGDAYEGLASPDAEWSTISSRKGTRKKSGRWVAATSTKFRLPITCSPTTRLEPDSKRRRISYIPPAPAKETSLPSSATGNRPSAIWKVTRIKPNQLQEKLNRDVDSCGAPVPRAEAQDKLQHEKRYSRTNRDGRLQAARNYPSSPRCNSSPPQKPLFRSPNLHIPAQLLPVMSSTSKSASSYIPGPPPSLDVLTRHSLPSPPRSDSPSVLQSGMCGGSDRPGGGGSIQLPFNSEMLADRYVKIRRKITERKQAAVRLWDDLDLPSCGIVYCGPDISAGVSRETVEIPIVVWQGRDVLNDRFF